MAVVPVLRRSAADGTLSVDSLFSLLGNATVDVDISMFSLKQLMHCVGKNCEQLSKSCTTLRHIILRLRNMHITLEHQDDFDSAVQWIREGYHTPPAEVVVRKYANALKGFLRMHPAMIPENPILTGTLPKWMFKGDEVDVFVKEPDSDGVWWHAVIVDDLPKNAKLCRVYWVGWEQCDTGNKTRSRRPGHEYLNNPTFVNRDNVRCHVPGKCSEGSSASFSVAWIRKHYCVVEISEDEGHPGPSAEEEDGSQDNGSGVSDNSDGSSERKAAKSKARTLAAKAKAVEAARKAAEAKASNAKAGTAAANAKALVEAEGSTTAAGAKSDASVFGTDVSPFSRVRPPCNDHIPDFGRSGKPPTAKFEQFYWALLAVDSEFCIQTLEGLAAGRTVHEESAIEEGKKVLKKRCCTLFALYGNPAFEKLYDGAVAALDSYEGKQSPFTSGEVIRQLRTFGFVLSPRMWVKAELLMLMCILVDKDLNFTSINQKDGKDEAKQNRCICVNM